MISPPVAGTSSSVLRGKGLQKHKMPSWFLGGSQGEEANLPANFSPAVDSQEPFPACPNPFFRVSISVLGVISPTGLVVLSNLVLA